MFPLNCIRHNLIVFALIVVCSNITVFCAELSGNGAKGDTTFYKNVPPKFVVTIPEDKHIKYKDNSTDIGAVSITKKCLEENSFVSVSLNNPEVLTNTSNSNYKIPFVLNNVADDSKFTGCRFYDGADAVDSYPLEIDITDESWDNAKSGSYMVELVFNIEYIVPNN